MKITKLTVRNYKSFGTSVNGNEDEIKNFSSINMVYGYNNSGKSNLLKFIQLIFQSKISFREITVEGKPERIQDDITFWKGPIIDSPFLFHKMDRNKPIEFEIIIKLDQKEIKDSGYTQYDDIKKYFSNTHKYCTFVLQGGIRKVDEYDTAEIFLTRVTLEQKIIYSTDANGISVYFQQGPAANVLTGDGTAFSNLLSQFNNSTLFLDNNRYLTDEKENRTVLNLSSKDFKNWMYKLYLDPKKYKIFEELNGFIKKYKIAAPNNAANALFHEVEKYNPLSNFNPEFAIMGDNNIELMFKRGKERYPLSSFGTGVQQILYILTTLFDTRARIILIEELELNLSPKYQSELFKILWALINDGRIDQVFFTTHSSYFDHRNDFSIYEVKIDSAGASKVTKVTRTKRNVFFKKIDL